MARYYLFFLACIISFANLKAAAPTTQASAINFTDIGCNSFTINWTNGNGSNRIAVVYPGAITGPTNGTSYTANNAYSSGGALGGGKVVYKGTGSSVIVVGLAANTTYTVVVFEFNTGPINYLTTTTNSITITTETTCSQCPTMTGAVIDACNTNTTTTGACPSCGEGDSEVLLLNSGSYGFNTALSPPQMDYFSSGVDYIASVGSYVSNAGITATLNAMTGCSNSFIDAGTGTVPPYSTIMIVRSTFCSSGYDFSNICGSNAPIYVLYVQDAGNASGAAGTNFWKGAGDHAGDDCSSGNFANHNSTNPTNRYFEWDFTGISSGNGGASSASCDEFYMYNANSLLSCGGSADGAGISFSGTVGTTSATATTPNNYTSCNCTLPIVLPIDLIRFSAIEMDGEIEVKWTTAVEINNDYFEVEYSYDSETFTELKKVKAVGNSVQKKDYSCRYSNQDKSKKIYFRLKQVDFNGAFKYSNIITVDKPETSAINGYYNSDNEKITIKFKLDYPQSVSLSLVDLSGKIIYGAGDQFMNEGNQEILLSPQGMKGIYILQIQRGNNLPEHKKILISK